MGRILVISMAILTLMAGTIIIGGITHKIAAGGGHQVFRRDATINMSNIMNIRENGIEKLFEEARAKKLRVSKQDEILHHGRIPI